jgi:hypothetical protein
MPTVLRAGPFRFFFYAGDKDEPAHIHVEGANGLAKFWLDRGDCSRAPALAAENWGRFKVSSRSTRRNFLRLGMSLSRVDIEVPNAVGVGVTDDAIAVQLGDARSISVPLAWYPRLLYGSGRERQNWRFIGEGQGIHWNDLDEDISVENLLAGRRSGESHVSFKRWLEVRGVESVHRGNEGEVVALKTWCAQEPL